MKISEEIAQLKSKLETADERMQAEILLEILKKKSSIKSTDSQPWIDRLLDLAEKLHEPSLRAWGIHYLAVMHYINTEYEEAVNKSNEAINIFEQLDERTGLAASYNNIGNCYQQQGKYPEALKIHFASLKVWEEIGDKNGMARSYNNIGNVYIHLENFPEALKNYAAALKAREEIGEKSGIALLYNNIGNIYTRQGNYPEALKNLFTSLEIGQQTGDKSILAASYANIGVAYRDQLNHPESLKYLLKSLKINQEIGDKLGIARSCTNIGQVYKEQGNDQEALHYLVDAYNLCEEIGAKGLIPEASKFLSQTYTSLGEHEKALKYYQKYHELEKETLGAESQKQLNNLSFMHDLEQKEKQLEIEQLQNQEKQRELEIEYLRNVELKKERDHINMLYEQIEEEKKKVDEKNSEIIQSITYAQKIQSAILPTAAKVRQLLPESFILYMPKDIVSGDFYWMDEIRDGRQGTGDEGVEAPIPVHSILFAACDCTGHGVPGAMVSLVCHNAINRAVHEYNLTQPSLILDKVCELVIESFKTSGPQTPEGGLDEGVRDGMDISLCAFDPGTMTLRWAGANSPLWLLRGHEVIEIKADKQPIGHSDYGKKFTNHTVDLQPGDIIYLFSDGYADQFGGAKGQKLTRKRMKQNLLDVKDEPMSVQGLRLEEFILQYKMDTFQTDDILLMGVKITGN